MLKSVILVGSVIFAFAAAVEVRRDDKVFLVEYKIGGNDWNKIDVQMNGFSGHHPKSLQLCSQWE